MGQWLWLCLMLLGWAGLGSNMWGRSKSALPPHFGSKGFSQVEGRSSESQAKPHKCHHIEYIHPHSTGQSKSPHQAQSHRGGVGLAELGSILYL